MSWLEEEVSHKLHVTRNSLGLETDLGFPPLLNTITLHTLLRLSRIHNEICIIVLCELT